MLKNLRQGRFHRATAIRASGDGRLRIEERGTLVIGGVATAAVVGVAIGAFILWQRGILGQHRPSMLTLLLAAFALAAIASGWWR